MSNRKKTRIFDDTFLNPYRQIGDVSADSVVEKLASQQGKAGLGALMSRLSDTEDLSVAHYPAEIQDFFEVHRHLPVFANAKQIARATAFFWRFEQQIALVLACYSLPYCYAAANGAQVLWLSARIKNDTQRRLEETGAFVFGAMNERDWANGQNVVRVLKVRLMHAVIRYFTKHAPQWNSDWGLPINQEDMAGTNLAFSYIVIRGLRKMNLSVSYQEEEDFLHLWNVIGHLLGVQPTLLPDNLLEAYQLDKQIAKRQFKASEAGQGLTKALVKTLEIQTSKYTLKGIKNVPLYYFLGKEVAELLNVKEPLDAPLTEWTMPIMSRLMGWQPASDFAQKYDRKSFTLNK
jgi:hypothetical protein